MWEQHEMRLGKNQWNAQKLQCFQVPSGFLLGCLMCCASSELHVLSGFSPSLCLSQEQEKFQAVFGYTSVSLQIGGLCVSSFFRVRNSVVADGFILCPRPPRALCIGAFVTVYRRSLATSHFSATSWGSALQEFSKH